MPGSDAAASRDAARRGDRLSRVVAGPAAPLLIGVSAVLPYAALAAFFLARHGFRTSTFVHAGDFYVDVHRLLTPIAVVRHSFGYDGQFYYRLALVPFSVRPVAAGIRFDDPAYRMGRVLYSLLVWLTTGGRASLASPAMLAVNLAGLGFVAAWSVAITRALRLAPVTPLLVMLWPGFSETLTHDTTEIVAVAFLLGAVHARVTEHATRYALLGIGATFSRETTLLVLAGLVFADTVCVRDGRRRRFALAGVLMLIPFAAWHEALPRLWHAAAGGVAGNLGVPFRGALTAIARDATALPRWHGAGRLARLLWPTVRLAIDLGIAFGFVAVLVALPAALLRGGALAAIGLGWLGEAALMSTLTAGGPWIDPTAIGRAFTECWVVGCLLLGAAPELLRRAPGRLGAAALATAMAIAGVIDTGSFLDVWTNH